MCCYAEGLFSQGSFSIHFDITGVLITICYTGVCDAGVHYNIIRVLLYDKMCMVRKVQ